MPLAGRASGESEARVRSASTISRQCTVSDRGYVCGARSIEQKHRPNSDDLPSLNDKTGCDVRTHSKSRPTNLPDRKYIFTRYGKAGIG